MNQDSKEKIYQEVKRSIFIGMIEKLLFNKVYDDLKPMESFRFQHILQQYNKLPNKFQS
tara:strand:+ start:387 stop:563 length:177 start_codon:yes stop_codon:yes gene_type:complete